MKLNKRMIEGSSTNEIYVRSMEGLTSGKETVTIKRVSGITGPKAERTEMIALASVMGKSLTERNDKTFIFSQEFVNNNWDKFNSLISRMNGNCAYELRSMRAELTDDQKENGKRIAIYNEVFNRLIDRMTDTALDSTMIRDKMRSYGYAAAPTLKYESTVKLGGKKKMQVNEFGWKLKNIDGNNWYVKTADTIGAKAVPINGDKVREIAVNNMNELEDRYNKNMELWSNGDEVTEESLLKTMEVIFPETLGRSEVEVFELSAADMVEVEEIANTIEGRIRDGK